jgi:hypothetical protein
LEIYNSHFTSKAEEWALGFCGDMVGAENPCLSVESISLENVVALDLSDRSIHKLPEVRYLISATSALYLITLFHKRVHVSLCSSLSYLLFRIVQPEKGEPLRS